MGSELPAPDGYFRRTTFKQYAKRTVTMDPHPYLATPHLSIHPCRHGNVMKRILDNLVAGGAVPEITSYLFIFLKFIQSVVPTIEYDFTADVATLGARRG